MNARCAEMRDIWTTTAVSRITTAAALAFAALSASGSTWWTANGDRVSWSDGANWNSGNPPPANDAAKFEHQ